MNWQEFLTKDSYTVDELREAKAKAGDWYLCATGEQMCERIPRHDNGAPKDERLIDLGHQFFDVLRGMWLHASTSRSNGSIPAFDPEIKEYRNLALRTIDEIDSRIVEILQQEDQENRS